MVKLNIQVANILDVLAYYDKIKVYRADSEDGVYSEITGASTRISLIPETTIYSYTDPLGDNTKWYKTSYYSSTTLDESEQSDARQGQTEADKIGWTFGNYKPPSGEWGEIVTADDLRWTYLWGIDATASDIAETEMQDGQFEYYIRAALADFERFLTIDIKKRIYKTNPDSSLVRAQIWREGVGYTDEDDAYDFDPQLWTNYGFVQLRHRPVISIERAMLYSPVSGEVLDLKNRNWIRLQKRLGQVNLFPTGGLSYGPYAVSAMPWGIVGHAYPQGFNFDYTTGYPTAEFVPEDLREVIAKWATIKTLASVGDGLLAGFSSQSVSLDGLSESFSSTQSATSAYFGARIKEYQDEVKDWLQRNRYKFSIIPMSFVGT